MKLNINAEVDIEDLAADLLQEEASQVIRIIDAEQQDANFTFELAKYFIKEVMLFADETEWVEELKNILEEK